MRCAQMALITSDCDAMRSPSIKWPCSPRVAHSSCTTTRRHAAAFLAYRRAARELDQLYPTVRYRPPVEIPTAAVS